MPGSNLNSSIDSFVGSLVEGGSRGGSSSPSPLPEMVGPLAGQGIIGAAAFAAASANAAIAVSMVPDQQAMASCCALEHGRTYVHAGIAASRMPVLPVNVDTNSVEDEAKYIHVQVNGTTRQLSIVSKAPSTDESIGVYELLQADQARILNEIKVVNNNGGVAHLSENARMIIVVDVPNNERFTLDLKDVEYALDDSAPGGHTYLAEALWIQLRLEHNIPANGLLVLPIIKGEISAGTILSDQQNDSVTTVLAKTRHYQPNSVAREVLMPADVYPAMMRNSGGLDYLSADSQRSNNVSNFYVVLKLLLAHFDPQGLRVFQKFAQRGQKFPRVSSELASYDQVYNLEIGMLGEMENFKQEASSRLTQAAMYGFHMSVLLLSALWMAEQAKAVTTQPNKTILQAHKRLMTVIYSAAISGQLTRPEVFYMRHLLDVINAKVFPEGAASTTLALPPKYGQLRRALYWQGITRHPKRAAAISVLYLGAACAGTLLADKMLPYQRNIKLSIGIAGSLVLGLLSVLFLTRKTSVQKAIDDFEYVYSHPKPGNIRPASCARRMKRMLPSCSCKCLSGLFLEKGGAGDRQPLLATTRDDSHRSYDDSHRSYNERGGWSRRSVQELVGVEKHGRYC